MQDYSDLSELKGERNPFNKYSRQHTALKVWAIVFLSAIVLVAIFFFAKVLLTYKITYETFDGSDIEASELKFLEIMEEPKETPKLSGYYLAGWTKDKDGNTPFPWGDKIWWSTTAYAKWEEGVALVLEFADGEENSDMSEDDLKDQYEVWLKPGSKSTLPIVYNQKEGSGHYGERLLWFEDEDCLGDPITTEKEYTLNESKTVYGKWFDMGIGSTVENFDVSDTGELKEYKGYARNIILPDNVKSIRARSIDNSVDDANDGYGTDRNDQSVFKNVMAVLERVYLNNNLEDIGDRAFKGCSNLKVVRTLNLQSESRLKRIGKRAFEGTAIETFEIPDSVEAIDNNAFDNTRKLSSVTGGKGLKTIGDSAFYCSAIRSITLYDVETVGTKAFGGCEHLKKAYFMGEHMINANTVTGSSDNVFEGTVSSSSIVENLKIYVPSSLLDAYKSSHPWNEYSSIIFVMPTLAK